jgi:hypothetical protein
MGKKRARAEKHGTRDEHRKPQRAAYGKNGMEASS